MDLIWGRYSPLAYSAVGSVVLIPLVINFHFLSPVLVMTIIFTAIGTFDFDADIGIVSAWNISVSGGSRGRADAREGLPYNICLRLRRNWE